MEIDTHKLLKEANEAQNSGKNELAKNLYNKILGLMPEHPDAHHNLSIILIKENLMDEARKHIEAFLETEYLMEEYYNTAGHFYLIVKEYEKSIELLTESIRLNNNSIKPYYLKGTALRLLGKPDESLEYFKKSAELAPDVPEVLNSYGVALASVEKFEESIKYYKEAIKLDHNFADSYSNLATALQMTKNYTEALEIYHKALELNPNNYLTFSNLASLYQSLGEDEKTFSFFKKSLELNPNDSEIYNNMGIAHGEFGRIEKAVEFYKKALEINPKNSKIFRHLATTGKLDLDEPIVNKMKNTYQNEGVSEEDKVEIGFGLGFILDKNKRFEEAFKYIKDSNLILSLKQNYDVDDAINTVFNMRDIYSKKEIVFTDHAFDYSPIFILGMPRSGTTMIERIISNHEDVDQMGELTTLSDIATHVRRSETSWPSIINLLDEDDYVQLGNDYLKSVLRISPNVKKKFTDKMPYNFLLVGLIRSIFPKSKIIHIQRDSRDNCLSIFMLKLFGTHNYAHTLKDLAKYYNMQFEIMNFWDNQYKDNIQETILRVQYEDLVRDPVNKTKEIFKYCELDYQNGNERFDLNENNVRTASNHQVREKINSSSINRWKNYESELKDLIRELNNNTFSQG